MEGRPTVTSAFTNKNAIANFYHCLGLKKCVTLCSFTLECIFEVI